MQITQLLFEKSQLLYFLWYEKTDEELRANFKSRFEVTKGGCKKKKKNTGKAQDFVQNYKRHVFQMIMNFTWEKDQVG